MQSLQVLLWFLRTSVVEKVTVVQGKLHRVIAATKSPAYAPGPLCIVSMVLQTLVNPLNILQV